MWIDRTLAGGHTNQKNMYALALIRRVLYIADLSNLLAA
jgi:hypothetical protein